MCRNDHKCCVCLNFPDNQDTCTNERDRLICSDCNASIFSFVNIESEIDYLTVIRGLSDEECGVNLLNSGPFLNSIGTDTVKWNLQMGNNDIHVDPDINLFNGVKERDQYVDFNRLKLKMDYYRDLTSIMPINCRSVTSKLRSFFLEYSLILPRLLTRSAIKY